MKTLIITRAKHAAICSICTDIINLGDVIVYDQVIDPIEGEIGRLPRHFACFYGSQEATQMTFDSLNEIKAEDFPSKEQFLKQWCFKAENQTGQK